MQPRRGAAVLGSPIAHSLSPVLHRAAYDALGLANWAYRAIECSEADLGATLQSLEAEGLQGVSLTMPLKRAVMPMLTVCDEWARLVGAANTVLFSDRDGKWLGENTDVPGMVAALAPSLSDVTEGQRACVLGAGATAASAVAAIGQFGFGGVDVFARRPEAATGLATIAASLSLGLRVRHWGELGDAASSPLVVSTVPAVGTAGLATSISAVTGLLFDVVYSPWPTPLGHAWQQAGGRVIGGLELLIEQAALQVGLMTGQTAPIDRMREAGYAALAGRP
jgi:shikimate dehydrogenase